MWAVVKFPKDLGEGRRGQEKTTTEPGMCMAAGQEHQRKGDGLSWRSRNQEEIIKIQK